MTDFVECNHERSAELMRTIVDEADGWDPQVRVEYMPSERASGSHFRVTLNVKGYRRHDRQRVVYGKTPVLALEQALTTFRFEQP